MDYREAMDYLESVRPEFGSDISLNEVRELSRMAGSPEDGLKIVHIAGTNGKGSVGNFICNILAISGYVVGRYVSPALFDYRERIQRVTGSALYGVQSEYITKEEVAQFVGLLKSMSDDMVKRGFKNPTPFEIETVMAFLAMKKWKVDVAVVEAGMGGRLDATNIVKKPAVSVITSIDMDHMQFLGSGLLDIARQKIGIVKRNVPVVAYVKDWECAQELKAACLRNDASLCLIDGSEIRPYEYSMKKTSFIYRGEKYDIGQAGVYQVENAAVAVKTAETLYKGGFRLININSIKEGLLKSRWRGRFDVVSSNPFVIADGAHNPSAARALRYSLDAYFPGEKFNFIVGIYADKEYEEILRIMLPCARRVYVVTAPGSRGLSGDVLADCVKRLSSSKGQIFEIEKKSGIKNALNCIATMHAPEKTLIFGSLSLMRDAYEYFAYGRFV